jgi:hypothetical protein
LGTLLSNTILLLLIYTDPLLASSVAGLLSSLFRLTISGEGERERESRLSLCGALSICFHILLAEIHDRFLAYFFPPLPFLIDALIERDRERERIMIRGGGRSKLVVSW